MHTVTKHISGYDHDKYYIGITSKTLLQRCGHNGQGYKRQIVFWNAIQKYGWENIKHEIIEDNLTKEEACAKEIKLIEKYDTTNRKFGYNLTKGGEGSLGYRHSEEILSKMRGHTSWCKGKKLSSEFCKRISETHWDSSGLNSPKKRSVICLNNWKVFDLILEAGIYAGSKKYSKSISQVCS